jgi:alkylated DNA repair dioxygenase AlkB
MEQRLIAEGGVLSFKEKFLEEVEADQLFSFLKTNINWDQLFYTNKNKTKKTYQPRLTAWFADDSSMIYSYSGVTQKVNPWIPELVLLKNRIEILTGATYNSVLLNYYRDGNDSVGLHADDERELGVNANIASVSLGATRLFILSQYRSSDGSLLSNKKEFDLTNGSLLVMSGTTQHYWKHSIPKSNEIVGPRINLTYRKFYK